MENFYLIHSCEIYKFKAYLNMGNAEVIKKFHEINRKEILTDKFILVLESVKKGIANKSQWNWEDSTPLGEVYAIKVSEHRFYTLVIISNGVKELFISRYGKKESNTNDKKLTATIKSISKIEIQKPL